MQNLKYHALNLLSVMIFSFMLASTINQVVKFVISPSYNKTTRAPGRRTYTPALAKTPDTLVKPILESGLFLIAGNEPDQGPAKSNIDELTLLGTITGPTNISRAMIMKTGEKNPGVFALYKVSNEVSNDVFGYKLVGIADLKVYLEVGGQRVTLDMYAKKAVGPVNQGAPSDSAGQQSLNQTLSRSEIKQKVFNNLDNALRGLQAGPYRINGQIVGYRLINVRPYNILYKMGARSGDIIKRINGQVLDSTQKLMGMWEAMKSDARISVDLEREGKNLQFTFNITE